MWAEESVFYQIYPMGFCGVPFENDGVQRHEILKVIDWIPHMKKTGCDAIYFSPVFESDSHGYNTRDYRKIDTRIGTNEDFKEVCKKLHEAGIRVMLDGVFNHVGRGFWAFQDVKQNRENSRYCGWFHINFGGQSNYQDGFWYEGWEGHYDLVKLNLDNEEVVQHLLESVAFWIDEFGIDGLRLDVAYMVNRNFLRRLRHFCDEKKQDFYLIGEMIHGNYGDIVNSEMLHSATNYECYKGLYSSFNSMNMFEINHSLLRQFGQDGQGLYRGMKLLSFVDNHDVSRVASILQNEKHLPLIYAVLFGMPGIPCIYYGSEWGTKADKREGDPALRPCFDKPQENELTVYIQKLARVRKSVKALCYGTFRSTFLTNKQCIMEREFEGQKVYVAINADEQPFTAYCNLNGEKKTDLLTGREISTNGCVELPPYTAMFLVQPGSVTNLSIEEIDIEKPDTDVWQGSCMEENLSQQKIDCADTMQTYEADKVQSKKKIVILGDLLYDCFIWAERLPKKGETMTGYASGFYPGGKGGNQAVAAARLGADVYFIGKVGKDERGEFMINELKRNGVHTDYVFVDETVGTGTSCVQIDDNGDNAIVVAPLANMTLTDEEIEKAKGLIESADVFISQLQLDPHVILQCLKWAHNAGVLTIFNPAPAKVLTDEFYQYAHFITPNEIEASQFANCQLSDHELEDWCHKVAGFYRSKGTKKLIITLGSQGCFTDDGENRAVYPAYKVKAVDSTGAGDCFNAAFAVAYLRNLDIAEAVKFASAAAALCVQRRGSQPSMPMLSEVEQFLAEVQNN